MTIVLHKAGIAPSEITPLHEGTSNESPTSRGTNFRLGAISGLSNKMRKMSPRNGGDAYQKILRYTNLSWRFIFTTSMLSCLRSKSRRARAYQAHFQLDAVIKLHVFNGICPSANKKEHWSKNEKTKDTKANVHGE
jgi:hypothetical protein